MLFTALRRVQHSFIYEKGTVEEEMSCRFNASTTDTWKIDRNLKTMFEIILKQIAPTKPKIFNNFECFKIIKVVNRI